MANMRIIGTSIKNTCSCEIISILLSTIVHKINHNVTNIVKVESCLNMIP